MKLLKTMLLLTITAMFVVSAAFAGVESQKSASKVNSYTDIQSIFSAKKAANYSADDALVSSEVHPTYEPGLRTTDVAISCGGGSWESEVSWQIYGPAGDVVAEGGAPFAGAASLDDGVYTVEGQDAYGDGWNGNYLVVTIMETGVQLLEWTVEGTGGSTTFELSSTAVYGCTDPDALNYSYNCAGEMVEPTNDDGCCEYPTPPNDDCADAEPVTEYPATIQGSSVNAQVDCPGYLDWNAVWYELALPYDYNNITINVQAESPITNGGIVIMDDCNCDDFIPMGFNWDGAIGWIQLYTNEAISGPDNGGTILYPLFIDPQQGYTVSFDVTEDVWGCTDPNANNYNPDATSDDGSCTYDPCTTAWDLRMHMYDSFGDGWNGNIYTLSAFPSGDVLYSGTLETGTDAVSTPICLEDGNYGMSVDGGSYQSEVSWTLSNADGSGDVLAGGAPYNEPFTLGESDDVFGCTDPDACNFNPDATIDDGTCGDDGEICECAYNAGLVNGDPITGATTEPYEEHWYSFDVDQDWDNLTISLCGSDFDTKLDIYNGCDNFLVTNDDSPECGMASQFTLSPVTPGTGWVRIYGFGSSFGNYVLTLTAFDNPNSPALTATGIPGAVALAWEEVITRDMAGAPGQATAVYSVPNRAEKNEALDPVLSVTSPSYEPGLRTTDVSITCDGGSWQSEISWQIIDSGGNEVVSGGAPFAGDASLDDGVYTVNGQDAYGDGWNGNYLVVTDANSGTNYLNWTVDGTGGSTTFEISSAAVYGCMDPDALNYNYNCAGEMVEPTNDDGCCEYPTPANDNCEDAEVVTGPYPVEITSSSYNAQIDCEGFLNWNAVWYELELPYGANNVDIVVQTEGSISNAGIVIMDDCACDDFIGMSFEWDGANGWIHLYSAAPIVGPDNNGTILYPLFVDAPQGYTVTFNVTEAYIPSFNVYRDGATIAEGVYGNGYIDSDVSEGTEYCYTCDQLMPDGTMSDMSNTACASPDAGVGGGDSIEDPVYIDALPYTAFASTEWFTNMYDEACPYTGSASPDVVYSYTADYDEFVTIDLCGEGSTYDTKVYVYDQDMLLAGCSDDFCQNSTTNFLSRIGEDNVDAPGINMVGGMTYYIVVDGYGGQMGQYELNVTSDGGNMCADDGFEDDDTKDQATDHGGSGTWDYALCAEDNPDGIVQPGGFTAVDWSVVTVGPWSNLTVSTVGDPTDVNDIDLWVEDYNGDGICDWGGGDDLAGSGNAFTEEEALYSNLSDNEMTLYVGAIYFAGDNPINYSLSIDVAGVDCPECPQNLTASSSLESIDLAWEPPYVSPGGRDGGAGYVRSAESNKFDRDFVWSKKALQSMGSKDELKISGLHPYVHGNPEGVEAYNGEMKFQAMQASGRNSVASSFSELNEMLAAARSYDFVPGLRGDVMVYMWDAYGDGWNGNSLQIGDHTIILDDFSDDGLYGETMLTLEAGTYSVICDGGAWQSEVSWQIVDAADGAELLAGGAPYAGELVIGEEPPPGCEDIEVVISCDGGSWQSEVTWQIHEDAGYMDMVAEGGAPYSAVFCLTPGNYVAYGQDAYGDGWNGNMLSVIDNADGTVYLDWTVDGSAGETGFALGDTPDVYGCTDPDAANYDPGATIDDGSCVYWGDECEYPLGAMAGLNDASGENQFFSYTASQDGSVSISSDDGSGVAPDTYLYVLGSCAMDEYGNYSDVLGFNDDCCGYYGPSTVEVNVSAGEELLIYWYNAWGPGPFMFNVEEGGGTEECVDDSYEDNDGYETPLPIEPGTYDLQLCAGDADWFNLTVNNGQTITVTLTDVSETGLMDVGIFALEIDPGSALDYLADENYMEVSYSNNLDHPTEFLVMARDYYGQAEGPYTLTIALEDFEQTTYSVYRDGASIASDLLSLGYSDTEIADNVEYCYTVTASLGGVEGAHSNTACETHVYIEPPAAPTNVAAEGGWMNVGGVDYPSVSWTWDYDLPEGTNVNIYILTDNYGSETSWDITNSAGDVVTSGGGDYESDTEYNHSSLLEDGDYTFTIYDSYGDGICCAYGEGSYEVSLSDGTVLASGGEFGDAESTSFTIGGGRDESISVFNINDGSSEFVPGSRDIIFELCFEYYGTDYCFQTADLGISVYGFADGDLVCGWVYAVDAVNGIYSDASETACANAGGSGTVDVTVDHASGWNMVSVAVGTDANLVEDLFSGFVGGTLYEYPYNAVDALNVGQGYWLRFGSDGSDTQSGEPVDDVGIALSAGWNLIGSVSGDAGIGDPDGVVIVGTLYGYPYSDEVTSLEPGSGYWLRASADGMVYLSTSASLPRATAELTANSMTINGMELYFGVDVTDEMALSHSLPPKPPAGSFDVRFAGDTRIAEDAAVIDVMNSTTELTIDYDIIEDAGDHMLWVLSAGSDEFVLDGMGSIILSGSVANMTLSKVAEIPEAFGLSQNFPNPFNPVTNISFQVPQASDVTVSVYNMMGQKVADLVEGHIDAGFHQVVWDSRNLQGESVSSGVYLYTISSGNFHTMKKMILMK